MASRGIALRRAVGSVFSSRLLLPVLVVGVVIDLLPLVPQGSLMTIVISFASSALLVGYSLTYARRVAVFDDEGLPPLREVLGFVRRGVVALTAAFVLVAVFVLPGWFTGPIMTALERMPLSVGPFLLVFSLLNALGQLIALSAGVVLGARFAYYDRPSEAFRYISALKCAWRSKGAMLKVIAIELATGFVILSLHIVLSVAVGPKGGGVREALRRVASGQWDDRSVLLVAGSAAIAALSVALTLVVGHLIGQLAAIVYGRGSEDPHSAVVSPVDDGRYA